jgi:hypothetical protein
VRRVEPVACREHRLAEVTDIVRSRAPRDDRGTLAEAVSELRAGVEDVICARDLRLDAAVEVIQPLAVGKALLAVAEESMFVGAGAVSLRRGASRTSCATSVRDRSSGRASRRRRLGRVP